MALQNRRQQWKIRGLQPRDTFLGETNRRMATPLAFESCAMSAGWIRFRPLLAEGHSQLSA